MLFRGLTYLLISASILFSQTTTIPGDLRVKKHARIDSLANDSTMMVVADTLGRLTVLPIPGGASNVPGNPTGTVGLSAVNGSNTTYMRSDAAPALSQAIRPTWTDLHTYSDSVTFGSVITTPLTASRLLTVNASSQLAVNAALTANGFLYGTASGGIGSTSAAGNGQILIGSAGVAPVLGTLSGTTNQISISQGAGTLGISIPNILAVPDSLNVGSLTGVGIRMVVAGADGGILTQEIPSGVSPANPSATIGLSAVNGSATTYLRSDGAPALSQDIRPSWTNLHTFTDSILITSPSAGAVPSIIRGATSQSAALTQWQNDGTGVVATVSAAGAFAGTGYSGGPVSGSTGVFSSTVSAGDLLTASGGVLINGGTFAAGRIYRSGTEGLVIAPITGSSYDFSLVNAAGTNYLMRNPTGTNNLHFPTGTIDITGPTALGNTLGVVGVTTLSNLSGSGTRMVVADASGVLSTQSIPEAGSLANPTATIGLTAVNGSATSGMRSDGAPALSQAIAPTWTGAHAFTAGFSAHSGSNNGQTFLGGGASYNNAADGGSIMLSGSTVNTMAGYVEIRSSTQTGTLDTGTVRIWPAAGGSTRFGRIDGGNRWAVHAQGDVKVDDYLEVLGNLAVTGTGTVTGAFSATGGFIGHSASNNAQAFLAGGGSYNNAADGGWVMVSGASANTMAGYVEVRAGTTTGTLDTGTVRIWPSAGGSTRFGRIDEGNRWAMHAQGDVKIDDSLEVLGRLKHSATVKTVDTVASGTSIEIPLFTTDLITITLAHDATITVQDGAALGRHFTLRVKQDGTGGRDITWGSEFEFPGGVEPTQTTTANTWSYYSFMYNEVDNTWDFVGNALDFGGS